MGVETDDGPSEVLDRQATIGPWNRCGPMGQDDGATQAPTRKASLTMGPLAGGDYTDRVHIIQPTAMSPIEWYQHPVGDTDWNHSDLISGPAKMLSRCLKKRTIDSVQSRGADAVGSGSTRSEPLSHLRCDAPGQRAVALDRTQLRLAGRPQWLGSRRARSQVRGFRPVPLG